MEVIRITGFMMYKLRKINLSKMVVRTKMI